MPSEKSGRITARSVLSLLEHAETPPDWHALKAELCRGRHGAVRDLRLVLKGLQRNGEVEVDHAGFYHLPAAGEMVEGVVTQQGRTLLIQGVEVEQGRRGRLRAGDLVRARVHKGRATVVEVLSPSDRVLVGELNWLGRYPYVEALGSDYRGRVSLVDMPDSGRHGDIVRVEIIGEERRGLTGRVIDVLEGETVLARAVDTTLAAYHIPQVWPDGVRDAVAGLPERVANRLPRGRADLRKLPLVTIDGETAKDFDDAVYAQRLDEGWRLVVAIADVAHYVKKGGALDEEARERGNSVYLPKTVVPMLPEALSNDLCSLRPREPRLAMVCEMRIDAAGQVREHTFANALIRSWQRLTYTQVAAFLAGGGLDVEPEVAASLRELHACYGAMRQAREARGALDFDAHEAELELESGRVKAIVPVERNDAHRLIEEAMIAANVCAAQFLEAHDVAALYRVHEGPDVTAQGSLKSAFAMAGVRLSGGFDPRSVQRALEQIAERPDAWVFQMLVLRSMQQAVYQPAHQGHFGLALERYMHFTSPIRRYADLVVHRAIKSVLAGKKPPYAHDALEATGSHISFTERRAEQAEWAVQGWLKCDFVADKVGEVLPGKIAGVTEFGLFVELTGFYVQGLVHISELGDDYYRFQPQNLSLVGERSGEVFRLGDTLDVRIREVRPPLGRIDLEINRGPRPGSRSKGQGKRKGRGEEKKGRRR